MRELYGLFDPRDMDPMVFDFRAQKTIFEFPQLPTSSIQFFAKQHTPEDEKRETEAMRRSMTPGEIEQHLGKLLSIPVKAGQTILGIPVKFLIKTAKDADKKGK